MKKNHRKQYILMWLAILAVGTIVALVIGIGLYCVYRVIVSDMPWWAKVFLLGK